MEGIVIIIGIILGSFISLVTYRLPLGVDIVYKRSYCPECNHSLNVLDLVPLFSWIFNFGKCRYCHSSISARYPIIEISSATICYFIYNKFGVTFEGLIYLIAALCLLVLIVTDFEHYIIPDSIQLLLTLSAISLGIINQSHFGDMFLGAAIGISCGLTLRYGYLYFKKIDALGMGDIKFMGVAGLFLGTAPLSTFFFLAGIIGVILAICWRMLKKGEVFPFGPALAVAMIICLFTPQVELIFAGYLSQLTTIFVN